MNSYYSSPLTPLSLVLTQFLSSATLPSFPSEQQDRYSNISNRRDSGGSLYSDDFRDEDEDTSFGHHQAHTHLLIDVLSILIGAGIK